MQPALDSLAIFDFPIPAVLSLRDAGDMGASSTANRRTLMKALHVEERQLRTCCQNHTRRVVSAEHAGPSTIADGIVTTDAGLVLGVTVADCMPIFLFDRRTGAYGVLHSGWKGTGIFIDAVEVMGREFAVRASDLTVLLGPAIGARSYEVDLDRARLFGDRWGAEAVRYESGRAFLNLLAANMSILETLGVEEIVVVEEDTYADDRYGSFRREGTDFTRMLALIGHPLARYTGSHGNARVRN